MKCQANCNDGRPCPHNGVMGGYCILHFKKEIIDKNNERKRKKKLKWDAAEG